MNDPFRPPLHPIAREQIKMLLDKVDQQHWPLIAAWRVPKYFPLDTPVPSQSPLHFLNSLQVYASALLKVEADQYEPFRSYEQYPVWLSNLTERILVRVLDAVEKIEQGNPKATLWYHGLTQPEIAEGVRETLLKLTHPYTGGVADPQIRFDAVQAEALTAPALPQAKDISPAPVIETAFKPNDRKALRDSYLAAFPDALKL